METQFDITKLHEDLFVLLSQLREKTPNLTYTYRKSNHASRLEDGYWFYGNDNYLAISFWSGMDWKNRTPNIVFIILSNGDCYLEVNVSDSVVKRNFVESFMVDVLDLDVKGRKYIKYYDRDDLATTDILLNFIKTDKLIIDQLIKEYKSFFDEEKEEDKFGFISKEEFKKRHTKVNLYRDKKMALEDENEGYFWNVRKPSKIKRISIKKYGPIENIEVDLDINNEWVFITGPNGTGKTLFLRAIAAALGNKILKKKDYKGRSINDFEVEGELVFKDTTSPFSRKGNYISKDAEKPLVQGLAMYGPYRLDVIDDSVKIIEFKKKLRKRESFLSLFTEGEKLLNIDKQLSIWRREKPNKFEKLKYYIRSVLTDIVPDLVNINFDIDNRGRKQNIYVFQRGENAKDLEWEDLSSGTKSVFALLGDILIRLYNYQKTILDPSEFTGVVIIDEIDLHLHPQAQKDLVKNLAKTFPQVQFIVSTHSPIPLLGAPPNSSILKVTHDYKEGVISEKLDIDISNLLPNTLLSSPIFGFDDLFPDSHNKTEKVRTEDLYDEVLVNKENREYLKSIAKRLKKK